MRRVCVVVTARPSYSRISTAMAALRERADVELQVVVAASALLERYGSAVQVIEADGFEVAARVTSVIEGENPTAMAKTTGLGLLELAGVFDQLRPDLVVTVADRFETMATAVAAAYMNLPLAHVQGGEVTGSIDEKVRHAVTKLADLHLVSTEGAAERVRRMGERPDRVHVTGCPSLDLAAQVDGLPPLSAADIGRYGGVGDEVDLTQPYLVVLQHPVTTEYVAARAHVTETLHAVVDSGLPALWFWPNVDAGSDGTSNGIRTFREVHRPERVHFFKNLEPRDFLRLAQHSAGLVGNSSVAIREASFLGIPAVNVGTRQAGRERGHNVVDVDYDRDSIGQAIVDQCAAGPRPRSTVYGDGRSGPRIAELLATAEVDVNKRLTY